MGKSLCFFRELASHTFRVRQTDRREKKQDFWYPLDKEIFSGKKAFSVSRPSIFEHFIVWVHLCGFICSVYPFLRLLGNLFFSQLLEYWGTVFLPKVYCSLIVPFVFSLSDMFIIDLCIFVVLRAVLSGN